MSSQSAPKGPCNNQSTGVFEYDQLPSQPNWNTESNSAPLPPPTWHAVPANAAPIQKPTIADLLFALAVLASGFYFWHSLNIGFLIWQGIGVTLFFLFLILATVIYLYAKDIKQNHRSWLMLVASVLGAMPFALYGHRDINMYLIMVEITLCLLWVMYSCRTAISEKINLSILFDMLNQFLIVPFTNFGRFFTLSLYGLRNKSSSWRYALFAFLGLLICLPVFFFVTALLASSDDGFGNLVRDLAGFLANLEIIKYLMELLFAIPIAAYIFGAVIGNITKRQTNLISEPNLLRTFVSAHAIPKSAIYAPLFLFLALYITYFIAVGSYLFSGLQGSLPEVYTYAEYARRGFFELCTIASLNLVILGGIWLFTKRDGAEHPLALRALAGAFSLLTCLLIITALSKMLLYIGAYGLTPARVFTTWFMVLMLIGFCIIAFWHAKPFNAAKPIIAVVIAFSLALGLTNTNAIIANYNVDRYLDGTSKQIDVYQLRLLGYPALDALRKLEDGSVDVKVKTDATAVIEYLYDPFEEMLFVDYNDWATWSLERLKAHGSGRK